MEALITLLLSSVTKFLNYLNINPRLQNKIITIASVFPMLYLLVIVKGFYEQESYLKATIYLLIFIVLCYFTILNIIYYFGNKKMKWDVTNLIEDIVPEDATFAGDVPKVSNTGAIKGTTIQLELVEQSDAIIEQVLEKLLETNSLTGTDLGHHMIELDKYTIIPFYRIKKDSLLIGNSYSDLQEVAKMKIDPDGDNLIPLGVFVKGGAYELDGIVYKEPYSLELRVKDTDEEKIEDEVSQN